MTQAQWGLVGMTILLLVIVVMYECVVADLQRKLRDE